jgi:hypothetical protein
MAQAGNGVSNRLAMELVNVFLTLRVISDQISFETTSTEDFRPVFSCRSGLGRKSCKILTQKIAAKAAFAKNTREKIFAS